MADIVLCTFCGDENVTPLTNTFAEVRGGKAVVYRWYKCDICNLEFKWEDDGATKRYYKARLDNKGRND